MEKKEYTDKDLLEELKKQAMDIRANLDGKDLRLQKLKTLTIDDKDEDIELTEKEILMLVANNSIIEKVEVLKAIVSARERIAKHGNNAELVIKNEIQMENIRLQEEYRKSGKKKLEEMKQKYEQYNSYRKGLLKKPVLKEGLLKSSIKKILSIFKSKKTEPICETETIMKDIHNEIEVFLMEHRTSDFTIAVKKADAEIERATNYGSSLKISKLKKELSILDGSKYQEACDFFQASLKFKNNNASNKTFGREK